jgi:ABC-type multidrug transport system ATPase subunit
VLGFFCHDVITVKNVNIKMWSLQVKGSVSYNGYKLEEFVPQKTSVYISQNDLHVGEMTVRETLDFSARCQGIGTRYGQLELPCELPH